MDSTYASNEAVREADIRLDRGTNYSVVRTELLEHLYSQLYEQQVAHDHRERYKTQNWSNGQEDVWMQHQILPYRSVTRIEDIQDDATPSKSRLRLHIQNASGLHGDQTARLTENIDVDAVVVASGYIRDAHKEILNPCFHLKEKEEADWSVDRDYRVKFRNGSVAPEAGVWLQGCCEESHGLSDTLLSILATRAGGIVDSIFSNLQY